MERVVTPALARIVLHIYVPSVLMGFGLGMLLPTLPILARSFGGAPEMAAQAVTALLIGRTASLFPCGYVVAPDARGSVRAFRRSVGEVGAFSGPIVGGLVAGMSHAGVAFAAFAPLHIVSALLVTFVARETLNRMPRPEPRPVAGR